MAKGPTKEQVSALRWVTIIALVALFVADYGLDSLAKPAPPQVYYILGAIAIGIDLGTLRSVVVQALRNWANGNKDD